MCTLKLNREIIHAVNPFDLQTAEGKQLFYVASGRPANLEDEHDLLNYIANGEEAAAHFIQTRSIDKSEQFHASWLVMHKKTV